MREAVIVEAVRTPIARGKMGKGDLSGFHPAHLLAKVQQALVDRAGIDPAVVEQVVGGCVTQAGEQSNNLTRVAWLSRGKGWRSGGTTVDTQCGSGQQANHIISAFVRAGSIDAGIACGVEVMSHVGLGANVINGPGYFQPPEWPWDSTPDQFTSAERIVKNRGITREELDRFGLESQHKAAAARDAGRFDREILPIEAPVLGDDGKPTGATHTVKADQGIRPSTLEGLAALKPVIPGASHTAGTSSQISDGAAGLLWMSKEKAKELGLKPRARIVQGVVVGTDPYYLLDGPIDATNEILRKTGMKLGDFDLIEINEAFASQGLACLRQLGVADDAEHVNPHGGAIALGHPLGMSGTRITMTAAHGLEARGGKLALATMCVGVGQGVAIALERVN